MLSLPRQIDDFVQTKLMQIEIQSSEIAIVTADVAKGWRKLKNTFGFCEESRLELSSEEILRVQASIRAWPNKDGIRLLRYPTAYGRLVRKWGYCELRESALRINIVIPIVRTQRLPKSQSIGIYEPPTELDKPDRVGFWFSLLVTLTKPQREYPDIFEWDTPFLMGVGQEAIDVTRGLAKRKHRQFSPQTSLHQCRRHGMGKPGTVVPGKNFFHIKCNPGFLQYRCKFFFVCTFPMMLCLVLDVMLHCVAIGTADAECAVSLLPRELDSSFAQPSRRICF